MRRMSIAVLALCILSPLLAGADVDPEPPGKGKSELRRLQGTWTVNRTINFKSKDKPASPFATTYSFDGDKLTYDSGKTKWVAKVKVNTKNQPHLLELAREESKTASKMAYRIEKGELYLVTVGKWALKTDEKIFNGKQGSVSVSTRQKQDR